MNLLKVVESEQIRKDIANFSIGDRVRVYIKFTEGDKERSQAFEGIVIAKKHGGMSEILTVRRVTYGEGVERTFMLNAPNIEKIEVVTRGSVRRAKLYYLRGRSGKASRIKEARYRGTESQE